MRRERWGVMPWLFSAIAAAFFMLAGGRAYAAEIACQIERGEAVDEQYLLTLCPEEHFLPLAEESSATLDGQKCGISEISSASHEAVGVTYDALVDISGSMRYDNRMEKAREILRQFVSGMKEGDLFRLTRMGNERSSQGFLSEPGQVNAEIDALESIPQEDTNLYKSLVEELDELKRENTNWKKLLLILSDGKDDQRTGITKEEADLAVQESWIPVYTVAMLRSDRLSEGEEDAKLLGSFARLSHHGEHFAPELEDYEYSDIYGMVMDGLDKEFMVSLDFKKVMTRNQELPLKLSLSDGSTTAQVEDLLATEEIEPLLGLVYEEEPAGENQEEVSEEAAQAEVPEGASAEAPAPAQEGGLFQELTANPLLFGGIIGAAVLILVLVIVLIIVLVRRKKQKPVEEEKREDTVRMSPKTAPEGVPGEDTITLTLTRADNSEACSVTFSKEALMGRGLHCDLSFPQDGALSERHCSFRFIGGELSVTDHDSTNGTYLNGIPVGAPQVIRQGDTLLAGSSEYTVTWNSV